MFKKSQLGLTLIETLLALSIGAVFVMYIISFIAEQAYQQKMRISAQNITTINSAFMRRVAHDGLDFEDLVGNDTDTEIVAGTEAGTTNNFTQLLNPDEACGGGVGNWTPKNTNAGDYLRQTPMVSCNINNILNNDSFGLDYSFVVLKDDSLSARSIIGLKIIIDFADSELFLSSSTTMGWGMSGANRISQYMDMIESRLASDLIGTQRVYLGTTPANLEDFGSYTENDVNECFIDNSVDCDLILELNFSGGFNQQYLRTDGMNSMLAPINFALSGADADSENYQQCVIWRQDASGDWITTGTGDDIVDCGLVGGEGYEYDGELTSGTQSRTDSTQTGGLFIALKGDDGLGNLVRVDNACNIFTNYSAGSGFVDQFTGGASVPCGIYNTAEFRDDVDEAAGEVMVQVLAQSITSQTADFQDLASYNLKSRSVQIVPKNDAGGNPISGSVFSICDENDFTCATPIMDVSYDSGADIFNFTYFGNTSFTGDLSTTGGDVSFDLGNSNIFSINSAGGNLTFSDTGGLTAAANNLRMSIGELIMDGTNLTIDYSGLINVDNYNDLNLNGSNINIDSSVELLDNNDMWARDNAGIYSEYSTFNDNPTNYTDDSFNRLATYDSVAHLKHFRNKIQLRYVNVVSGGSGTVPKPNCFDMIPASEREIYTDPSSPVSISDFSDSEGRALARIVLVPITFRTYSGTFGNNQFYTHVAQDAGANWNLFFYFSGDGIGSTGAREDGSGSSLAMIYCDYSSIL